MLTSNVLEQMAQETVGQPFLVPSTPDVFPIFGRTHQAARQSVISQSVEDQSTE